MAKIVLVVQAYDSRGFAIATELAMSGDIVYAGVHPADNINLDATLELQQFSEANGLSIRIIEIDTESETSVAEAINTIIESDGRLDVIVYRVGASRYMLTLAREADAPGDFHKELMAEMEDAKRVSRSIVPILKRERTGLLIWVPGFQAAVDALAFDYRAQLKSHGVETSIIYPGDIASNCGEGDDITSMEMASAKNQARSGVADRLDLELALAVALVARLPFGRRPPRIDAHTALQLHL